MSDSAARPRFSRFDRLVAILAVVVTAAIALLAWRGDQVGIDVVTMTPAAAAGGVSTRSFPLKGPNIVISVWVMDAASGEQWQVTAPGQRPQLLP